MSFSFVGPATVLSIASADPEPETRVVHNLTEFRALVVAPPIVLLTQGDGILYYLDADDTTSVDNGASVIVATTLGSRYKQLI